MVLNYNNADNYWKGRWLEYPVYEAYSEVLLDKCGSVSIDYSPTSDIERVIYAPSNDPKWKVIWYRPNQGTAPPAGSRPDFEIFDQNQLVEAVECKNVNSGWQIYDSWFAKRIANRFNQPSQHKLLIISYWNPYPSHQHYLNIQLSSLKLEVLSLGKQITLDDEADVRVRLLTEPVFRKPFP
jgi:hypothetical protein